MVGFGHRNASRPLDVSLIAHYAVGKDFHAREVCNAPHSLDKARPLVFVEVECPVRHPADQMVTHVRNEVSRLSHADIIAYFPATPPLQTPPTGSDPEIYGTGARIATRRKRNEMSRKNGNMPTAES